MYRVFFLKKKKKKKKKKFNKKFLKEHIKDSFFIDIIIYYIIGLRIVKF